jgi:hypothetical protein
LTDGGVELVVDPRSGGRALRLSLNGTSLLVGTELAVEAPTADLDSRPYAARVEGTTLVLEGEASPLGLALTKRYRLDGGQRSVHVSYALFNPGQQARRAAAWESLRVPALGVAFYPSTQRRYPQSTLELDAAPPISWFSPGENRALRSLKALADGSEGWLAYARDEVVLIRAFTDTPAERLPADQGELETFAEYDATTQRHRYVELTVRGPEVEIPPGASSNWSVRWLLRPLPPSVVARSGNPELAGFVRGVIQ